MTSKFVRKLNKFTNILGFIFFFLKTMYLNYCVGPEHDDVNNAEFIEISVPCIQNLCTQTIYRYIYTHKRLHVRVHDLQNQISKQHVTSVLDHSTI